MSGKNLNYISSLFPQHFSLLRCLSDYVSIIYLRFFFPSLNISGQVSRNEALKLNEALNRQCTFQRGELNTTNGLNV